MSNIPRSLPSLSRRLSLVCFLVIALSLLLVHLISPRALERHGAMLLATMAIGVVVAVVVVMWLTQFVTRPLQRLARVAEAYAQEQFAVPVPAASIREVHELGRALQAMAEAIGGHLAELTTQRNQATAIVESLAEGVIALDAHGHIVLFNPAAGRLLGATAETVVGRSLFETIRQRELHELARAVLQHRQRATRDVTLFQPQERFLRVHGLPCEGAGADPTGPRAILVIQDVTEHVRYDQLRKEFVANVSHELKSPLTSIRSLIETLLSGALEDPANNRRFVQLIEEDATRLSCLIDDLLSLSQIESQAVPLKLAVVPLKPLVDSVIASCQSAMAQRGIRCEPALPDGLAVHADADRLRQILANLLDNAIKYNKDHGSIQIAATREGEMVKVTVSDTGIGIPAQDLPRIFERFYRVDKARSRELGGTGLGLSIVKHLVESHRGTVSVESRFGHGSAFSFTLPLVS